MKPVIRLHVRYSPGLRRTVWFCRIRGLPIEIITSYYDTMDAAVRAAFEYF